MADSLADIKKDRKFWQRMLRFAGYYDGAIDGILGTKSKAAAAAWDEDAQRIKPAPPAAQQVPQYRRSPRGL